MRRTLPFVALWFCGGALAVAVASVGVAVVDDQLTESRPAPLSAEEVRERLEAGGSTSTTADGVTTTASIAPPPTTATTASPATTGGTDSGATGGPGTPTTTAPAMPSETHTYELVGGTTTIRFSPTEIKVLTASPKPGFTAEVEPESPGFKVEFESETHESRIDAWWSNGPQTRVREEADD